MWSQGLGLAHTLIEKCTRLSLCICKLHVPVQVTQTAVQSMYNLYPRTLRHLQEGHAIFHVNSADSKSVSVCDRSPTIGQVAYETAKRPNVRTRLRIVWLSPPFLHSGNYTGQGEPLIVLHVWQGSVVSHSFANVQEQREEGLASLLTSGAVEAPIVVQAKLLLCQYKPVYKRSFDCMCRAIRGADSTHICKHLLCAASPALCMLEAQDKHDGCTYVCKHIHPYGAELVLTADHMGTPRSTQMRG